MDQCRLFMADSRGNTFLVLRMMKQVILLQLILKSATPTYREMTKSCSCKCGLYGLKSSDFFAIFQSDHPMGAEIRRAGGHALRGVLQSAHPVRGGTWTSASLRHPIRHFNPPTPCGVGLRETHRLLSQG